MGRFDSLTQEERDLLLRLLITYLDKASPADNAGTLAENVEVKQFLLRPHRGQRCGDLQVEKGAVLAGGVFSIHPKSDQKPAIKDAAPLPMERRSWPPPNRVSPALFLQPVSATGSAGTG
ncbi:MAG: hypothetical protein WBW08_11165 [Methyloceanibacter sp.]